MPFDARGLVADAQVAVAASSNGNGIDGRPFVRTDLSQLARDGVPPPTFLAGGYLYAGQLHSLAGPPDSGKSTILLRWMLEAIRDGQNVLLFDEEAGRESIVEKLLDLGATVAELEAFHYIEFPGRAWDAADVAGLADYMAAVMPSIVGFDSMAAFMARAGREENDARDVTAITNDVFLPLAREYRAAVVYLDHVTKDGAGGRYARGSGAKLASVDVAYTLDLVRAFSRAEAGLVKLAARKDRRGYLHRSHEVQFRPGPELTVQFERADAGRRGPSGGDISPAARKILAALARAQELALINPTQLSDQLKVGQIIDLVVETAGHGLRRETVSSELNALARLGLVEQLPGGGVGRANLWSITADGGAELGPERTSPESAA